MFLNLSPSCFPHKVVEQVVENHVEAVAENVRGTSRGKVWKKRGRSAEKGQLVEAQARCVERNVEQRNGRGM